MTKENVELAAAILRLTAALVDASNGRINKVEVDSNAVVYAKLSSGGKDNWINSNSLSFLTKDDMKNCRFSIFSKYIREMKEDFDVLQERSYIERILSHLNSSEIERFYHLAARITRQQKNGFSDWFSSSEGQECRNLYLKARRLAGLK